MIFPHVAKALSAGGNVAGVVLSLRGLRLAMRLRPGAVDFLELRLDALAGETAQVSRMLPRLKIPLVITVRAASEGGARGLDTARRLALYGEFLPHAALVDIELASWSELSSVATAARKHGAGLILSHHDFKKTPSAAKLNALARRAANLGADVFKVATLTSSAADAVALLSFLAGEKRVPLSVMGMGPLGKASRLLFAQAGSRLNYGFLDQAAVAGQWPAVLLKKTLAAL